MKQPIDPSIPAPNGASLDLAQVYAQLESEDAAQIAQAVALLNDNPHEKATAERRYLAWIRHRLGDPEASLEKLAEAGLTEEEKGVFDSRYYLGKDFISFGMADEGEVRLIVDMIGAIAKGHCDVEAYLTETGKAKDRKALVKYVDQEKKRFRSALDADAEVYPEGWFGKIVKKLADMNPDRVMFDHTNFESANESPLLQDFMLFAGLKCYKLYFDVFQSTAPDLIPVMWTLPYVPGSSWGDTTPMFPLSRLAFERKASYREGDDGRWLWHTSQFQE